MFEMKTWTFFFGEQSGWGFFFVPLEGAHVPAPLWQSLHTTSKQNCSPNITRMVYKTLNRWFWKQTRQAGTNEMFVKVVLTIARPLINRFEEATLATMTLPSGGIAKVTVPSPVSDGRAECSRLQAGGRVLGQSELTGRSLRRGGRSPPAQGGRRPPRRVRQARQQEVPGSRRRGQDQQRCPTTCSFFSSPLLVFLDGTSCLF